MAVAVDDAPVRVVERSKGALVLSLLLLGAALVVCLIGSIGIYALLRITAIALGRFEGLE